MTLTACHECDALQRKIELPAGSSARCVRCGCVLYRHVPARSDHYLALVIASLIVMAIANAFPIVSLEMQGYRHGSTLPGAVRALYHADMTLVAVLVLATAIVFPLIQLLLMLSLLAALRRGDARPGMRHLLHGLDRVRPWIMLDVFLMAMLVALTKLAHMATIIPGVGIWAFAALAFLMAAVAGMDPRALWERLPAHEARP